MTDTPQTTRWYVVACNEDADPEDTVWTLSKNPDEIGWETDGGWSGYGLLKVDAEFLATAANDAARLVLAERERCISIVRAKKPVESRLWRSGAEIEEIAREIENG